jgi:hypothetical protein
MKRPEAIEQMQELLDALKAMTPEHDDDVSINVNVGIHTRDATQLDADGCHARLPGDHPATRHFVASLGCTEKSSGSDYTYLGRPREPGDLGVGVFFKLEQTACPRELVESL